MEGFSIKEDKIIKIIGNKSLTIQEITDRFYKGVENDIPFDPNITISNTVSRIMRKCTHYGLSWSLAKSRKDNKMYVSKVEA